MCLFLNIGSTGVLNFFTVSSILVLWTEEVSGRCPETGEGRLPLDPRRGGPSGLAAPIFSLSSLEPKSLGMFILTIILVQVLCVSSIAVGTPGLGYPLLLCLGKGLVVILNYVQTAGPLWSGVLISRQRSRTCLTTGKGPGMPRVPGEAGAQPKQPGLRTSRGVRTPAEVPDPIRDPGFPRGSGFHGRSGAPAVWAERPPLPGHAAFPDLSQS